MTDRSAIARQAADKLRAFADARQSCPVTIGFDGFVDSIIAVVDKRQSPTDYEPIPTIAAFGKRISDSAGKSNNFELVTKLDKLGGNGPIMANAMAGFGLPVTYIGAVGRPEVHPVFAEFATKATCHSLCNPGFTDALEFSDGKLMMGKYEVMDSIGPELIDDVIGRDAFAQILSGSRFLGMVNWTMLTGMTDIFRMLADQVLPALDRRPMVFIDLCDPVKRTTEDLQNAMALLGQMQQHTDVILGLNLSEASQVAKVLGIDPTDNPFDIIEDLSIAIRQTLAIQAVVVHPRETAAAAIKQGDDVASGMMTGAFIKNPKLSTGAGDNFNAGFCFGLLAGLDVNEALCAGNAASGYYVRNAHSATLDDLATFLDDLPEPELD
jgi:sugar/nucleoside kinase (ribokinase family)